VEAGALTIGGRTCAAGAPLEAGVELRAAVASRIAADHARVTVAAGTVFSWHPDRSTLSLAAGSVRASIDPTAGRRFRIATPAFVAEVVGTELEVDLGEVRVLSGVVAIYAPDGRALADRLVAGERWRWADRAAAAAAVAPAEPASPSPLAAAPPPAPEPPAPDPPAAADEARPPAIDTVLAAARSQLAAGEVEAARALVDEAMATARRRNQRAEAETLHAEIALVAGDQARAIERYLAVADRYRDLGAGENALFAAARLEATRGRDDAAAALFRRYLDRYPRGRFRAEASRRLDQR
jgi:hypothetical protein